MFRSYSKATCGSMCLKNESVFQYHSPVGCHAVQLGHRQPTFRRTVVIFIFRGKFPTVQCNIAEVFKEHRCENLKSRKRFLRHGI